MDEALAKILEHISLNAQSELNELRIAHKKSLLKIEEQTRELIGFEKQKLNEKIEKFKKDLETKVNAENFIFKNKAVLNVKQRLFSYVLKKAAEALCCEPVFEIRYFKYMENLIEKNLPDESCVLIYGELDYLRFAENLKFQPSNVLKIEKTSKFRWGAKILCSQYDVDLNIEHLINDRCDKFKLEVLNILINKDVDL